MNGSLNLDKLLAMKAVLSGNLLSEVSQPPLSRIIVSASAVKKGERLFPVSRNRSARIHKKLIKRFGGEYRQLPAIYHVGENLLIHPSLEGELHRVAPLTADRAPYLGFSLAGIPIIRAAV